MVPQNRIAPPRACYLVAAAPWPARARLLSPKHRARMRPRVVCCRVCRLFSHHRCRKTIAPCPGARAAPATAMTSPVCRLHIAQSVSLARGSSDTRHRAAPRRGVDGSRRPCCFQMRGVSFSSLQASAASSPREVCSQAWNCTAPAPRRAAAWNTHVDDSIGHSDGSSDGGSHVDDGEGPLSKCTAEAASRVQQIVRANEGR